MRLENEKLREDLLNAKTRSKRLCNILAQGESMLRFFYFKVLIYLIISINSEGEG